MRYVSLPLYSTLAFGHIVQCLADKSGAQWTVIVVTESPTQYHTYNIAPVQNVPFTGVANGYMRFNLAIERRVRRFLWAPRWLDEPINLTCT